MNCRPSHIQPNTATVHRADQNVFSAMSSFTFYSPFVGLSSHGKNYFTAFLITVRGDVLSLMNSRAHITPLFLRCSFGHSNNSGTTINGPCSSQPSSSFCRTLSLNVGKSCSATIVYSMLFSPLSVAPIKTLHNAKHLFSYPSELR